MSVASTSGLASAADETFQVIDPDGQVVRPDALPPRDRILELYRHMVLGRRFDELATSLARQGRLAVYASARGQEACQVAAALALRESDWLFPTYRDSVSIVSRGIDPVEVLTYTRGYWHTGYDPLGMRVAPQCSPLATHAPHGVGLAHAARLRGETLAALVLLGDGATSEGDAHEALNLAGVLQVPVVFLVQNNGYAISVPFARQTHASSLAQRAQGYGVDAYTVDGNDAVAVDVMLTGVLNAARSGGGPQFVEALTYRLDAHTNADDAGRYRPDGELESMQRLDPLLRLESYLGQEGALEPKAREALEREADALVNDLRSRLDVEPEVDPAELFAHVYATPTEPLIRQRELLMDELHRDAQS
jgi:pyruvate dehydrogenase E1 component alpha subunit